MKMVYSNENHFLANNIKNLIEAQGIKTFIKNEFSQGAVGEISAFDAWPEVWVYENSDFERAEEIVKSSQSSNDAADWLCHKCSEKNDPSFEICWHCQSGKS
ncbi:MAG: DUF2007 domain-containing protein [Colwellia sp.]|nr:DUF2007 domain-containing protein [Colwellia sp.]MCW8866133.1 DUF2007 domain-containing protein [Colwellia sp.]MCW9082722.1 DUF2007 domain-containing protein [Colwellia sp.]